MEVSVVIPVHGNVPYLRECLKSIWDQKTRMLIKIIVVIDRDANISRDLIEESNRYLETDVIHSIGTGISDALNTGIHYASQDWMPMIECCQIESQGKYLPLIRIQNWSCVEAEFF
jgi:glycosyltransferase involved in cell wall biosynthesis